MPSKEKEEAIRINIDVSGAFKETIWGKILAGKAPQDLMTEREKVIYGQHAAEIDKRAKFNVTNLLRGLHASNELKQPLTDWFKIFLVKTMDETNQTTAEPKRR
jgi:hypothetical protein